MRIDEALRIERERNSFESLVIKVWGKGSKERLVLFSEPMRRVLCRRMQKWVDERPGQRVFAPATGAPIAHLPPVNHQAASAIHMEGTCAQVS
jgi:site-specific recombinase XerD